MHEVEEMIRLILKPGPQRGRDVIRWASDASKFSRAKVYQIATEMVTRGDLERGMWILQDKSPEQSLRRGPKLHAALTEAVLLQREKEDAA